MRVTNNTTRRRRKRVLKLAKGYQGAKHRLYRVAKQQVMKSYMYQYRDRKNRKRFFRKLWISRISIAAKSNGLSYSVLMNGLKKRNIQLNRKVLADMAVRDEEAFKELTTIVKEG